MTVQHIESFNPRSAQLKVMMICLAALFYGSIANAQTAGSQCELAESTKLFKAKTGKKYSSKLSKATKVVLEVLHQDRWQVKTSAGDLGYINVRRLKSVCKWTAPSQGAGSVAENIAALDVSKALAEKPTPGLEPLVRSQAKVIQQAQDARVQSQQEACVEKLQTHAYRVAVYNLELVQLPEGMGQIVSDALLAEVRKLEGISAIGMDEMTDMLEHEVNKQMVGCDADESCMAEIAGALGVDEIITGRISEQADGRQIVIRRIDQRRASVVETVDQRLEISEGEEFLLAIGPGVKKLYPNHKLRPGAKRGVPEKLLLKLNPPPIAASITLGTITTAALSLAAGGTFAYLSSKQQNLYQRGGASDEAWISGTDMRDIQARGDQYMLMSNITLIGGGVLALASGVMSLFTDWDDLAGQEFADE